MKVLSIGDLVLHQKVVLFEVASGMEALIGLTLTFDGTETKEDEPYRSFLNVYYFTYIAHDNLETTWLYQEEMPYCKFLTVEDYEKLKAFL